MADVIRLILDDHETRRCGFGELAELREDPARAPHVWARLGALLEMHASAEDQRDDL